MGKQPEIPVIPSAEATPRTAPTQSFRVVGGIGAGYAEVAISSPSVATAVVITTVGRDKFLVVPVQDAPMDGSSVAEEGYSESMARAKALCFLGIDTYIDDSLWERVIAAARIGSKLAIKRGSDRVTIGGVAKTLAEVVS